MNTDNQNLSQVGEALLHKFVNEEIMTKSELDLKLDNVMSKYIAHIDRKFDHIDQKFEHIDRKFEHIDRKFDDIDKRFEQVDIKYRWVIGLIVTATLSILGTVIRLH